MMTIRMGIAMLLIALGIFVIAVAIYGLFKYRDALQSLHAGALIDTLAFLLIMVGIALLCGFTNTTLKLVVLTIILWIMNPISSHLITRMELITGRDVDPDHLTGEGEMEL